MTLSPKKTLIAIDIDGTLDRYGGPISQDTIRRLIYFAHIGLVSSRADVHQVAKKLGLGFAETGKAKALEKYTQTYPEHLGKVYIADTELDDQEAKKVGWNFVYASDIKINLGCGYDLRRGYLNIDIREIKGVDLCYDISEHNLPLQDGIVSEILIKDFIEHLSWRKTDNLLNECLRTLKKGGKIHIQTPDLEAIAKKVILNPSYKNLYKTISYWVYGEQDYSENVHRSGFTIPSLRTILKNIGFKIEKIENDGGTNIICIAIRK